MTTGPKTGRFSGSTGTNRSYKRDQRGRFSSGGATGQAALDAAPATFTAGARGHYGDYAGEALSGPPGMGSVRALSEYEGVEYSLTNTYLRGARALDPDLPETVRESMERMNAETAIRVAEMDQTMAVSRLASDVAVERVIMRGKSVFGEAYHGADFYGDDMAASDRAYERWQGGERPSLTGLKWRDKGFVSTTADPAIADIYGARQAKWQRESPSLDGEPIRMTIHAPKGTGAVQLSPIDTSPGPKGPKSEAELLLQRGLTFEVVADHGVGDDGYRDLDIRVVPE